MCVWQQDSLFLTDVYLEEMHLAVRGELPDVKLNPNIL